MSAEQVTSTVDGAAGTSLGSVTGMLQGGATVIINMGKSLLDRFLPPQTREKLTEKIKKFATEKPYLASFLLSQIAISGPPLFLFVIMTVTIAIFALIVGLLVGLLGAVLFILAAVGFALVFLLPTLFFTTFAAVGIWLWGMAAYYIIKWFNEKEVPGVHLPMDEGLQKSTGLGDVSSTLSGQSVAKKPQPNGTVKKSE